MNRFVSYTCTGQCRFSPALLQILRRAADTNYCFGGYIEKHNYNDKTDRRWISTNTFPVLSKIETLSSSISLSGEKGCAVLQLVPVGTMVKKGDPIAWMKPTIGIETNVDDDDDDDDDTDTNEKIETTTTTTIVASQSGRIMKHYVNVHDVIQNGDSILEIDENNEKEIDGHDDENNDDNDDDDNDDDEANNDNFDKEKKTVQSNKQQEEEEGISTSDDHLKTFHQPTGTDVVVGQGGIDPLSLINLQIFSNILESQTDPIEKAQTRIELGRILYHTGDLAGSLIQLEASLELKIEAYGENHLQVAESYNQVGAVHKMMNNLDKALEYNQRAANILQSTFGKEHPYVLSSFNTIGLLYYERGDYREAVEYYERALSMYKKNYNDGNDVDNLDTANMYHNIGVAMTRLGQYDVALENCQKALDIHQQSLAVLDQQQEQGQQRRDDDDDALLHSKQENVAISHYVLGQVFAELGGRGNNNNNTNDHQNNNNYNNSDINEAIKHYQEAIKIFEKIPGMETRVTTISNSIRAIHYQGEEIY